MSAELVVIGSLVRIRGLGDESLIRYAHFGKMEGIGVFCFAFLFPLPVGHFLFYFLFSPSGKKENV